MSTSRSDDLQARTEALRTQEHLQFLTANTDGSVLVLAADATILYASPSTEDALGYAPDALVGQSFYDFLHEVDRARMRKDATELEDIFGKRPPYDPIRFDGPDGEERLLRGRAYNRLDDPRIEGVLLTFRVVEGEQGVEADAKLLLQAVAASNSSIVISDPNREDNPLVYINDGFKEFTGYTEQEALGSNCRFLQNDDRDQPGIKKLAEGIANGEFCSAVIRNYRKDGEMFWNELYVSPVHDDEGRLTHFIGVQNDITERVEAQQALRERTETLSSFYDSAPMLMGVLDRRADGEIVHVTGNLQAASFLGTTPEALEGASDTDVGLTQPCDGRWEEAYRTAQESGETARFECPIPAEEGGRRSAWRSTSSTHSRAAAGASRMWPRT